MEDVIVLIVVASGTIGLYCASFSNSLQEEMPPDSTTMPEVNMEAIVALVAPVLSLFSPFSPPPHVKMDVAELMVPGTTTILVGSTV